MPAAINKPQKYLYTDLLEVLRHKLIFNNLKPVGAL